MRTRHAIRVTGIALVAVLAAGLGLRLALAKQAARAARGADVLDPQTYVSVTVPDDENAATWLRAAAEALVLTREQREFVGDLTMTPVGRWTPAQHERLLALIAEARPVFELLERGVRLPRTSYGLDLDDLRSAALNRHKLPLLDLLRLQRLLYVTAEDALGRKDADGLFSAATPMSLVAVSLEREAPLIAGLVGVACDKMLVDVIRQAVAQSWLTGSALDRLDRLVPDEDLRAAWRRDIASEFALGPLRLDRAPVPAEQPLPGADEATRRAAITAISAALDDPFGSSADWIAAQERRISAAIGTEFKGHGDLVKAAGRFQHTLSGRRLAHMAIALRRGAKSRGSYPATLAAVPGASSVDPFWGVPPTISVEPDGSALLTVAGTQATYVRLYGNVHPPELLLWHLPAPTHR